MFFYLLPLLFLLLTGCSSDSDRKSLNETAPSYITEAQPQILSEEDIGKLPQDQQEFYSQLNSSIKPVFLSFSPEERRDAVIFSHPLSMSDAVEQAANHDVYMFPIEQQTLYFKLEPQTKILFFALGPEATDESVQMAKEINPNEAVIKAALEEVSHLPEDDQQVYKSLNIQMQSMFLTLTPHVRNTAVNLASMIDPNTAVKNASWMDVKRLSKDQQDFYEQLNQDMQIVFLLLTPSSRTMAMLLTQGMDPDTAVQYANRIVFRHLE